MQAQQPEQPQPPIFLLKEDRLPLVDVASSVDEAEEHLTGHDRYDRSQGGSGILDRPENSYYDSLGAGLEPQRTSDDRIQLVLTGKGIELQLLQEVVSRGFNALSAEIGAEALEMVTDDAHGNQELGRLIQVWPTSRGLSDLLRPPDVGLHSEKLLTTINSRFVETRAEILPEVGDEDLPQVLSGGPSDVIFVRLPKTETTSLPVRGTLWHNAWHIAKGICLSCSH
jgi:hypothetical protein